MYQRARRYNSQSPTALIFTTSQHALQLEPGLVFPALMNNTNHGTNSNPLHCMHLQTDSGELLELLVDLPHTETIHNVWICLHKSAPALQQ